MNRFWIFNIGTAEQSPPEDWLAAWPHHTNEMWFPPNKRPSGVRLGDRAVMNGSGRRGFIAVVEIVSSEPEPNRAPKKESRDRWPWILRYKLIVAIRADGYAPSLEDVGFENPLRLRRQPHVEVDLDFYERAAAAVVAAAGRAVAV